MRLTVAAALLTLAACSRSTEGPTPVVTGAVNPRSRNVAPARVCNAQGGETGWRLEVLGERFAPVAAGVLTDSPGVALPEVTLRGPVTLTLARERVFYVRPEVLLVDVPTRDSTPPVDLPAGSYALDVKNPLGGTASLEDAVVVVPPPTVTRVVPPASYSFGSASPFTIEGTDFQPGSSPQITLRRADGTQVSIVTITVVSPTLIQTEVPPGTPEGTYDLVLTNPDGCGVTVPQALTITYPRLGTLTVEPRFGWQGRNQPVTVYNTPTGEQRAFSAGAPDIFLLAAVKTDPAQVQRIPLRRVAVVSSSEVTAVVPTCTGFESLSLADPACPNGLVPGGPYGLLVADADGAVGEVPASAGFTVLTEEPPSITSITPGSTEAGGLGNNPLVVTGSGFGAGAKVQLLSQLASGNVLACDLASTGTPSATELRALVPGTIPAASCVQYTPQGTRVEGTNTQALTLNNPGLYVVRVQNTANPAFANYSGLVVTTASANPLEGPALTTRLATARADFPLVTATDDLGQTFMYALGGITRESVNGTPRLTPLSTVEVAQVTLFGGLAGLCTNDSGCIFRTLYSSSLGLGRRLAADGTGTMNTTPTPRSGHSAVVRTVRGDTSYLFLLGGVDETGTALRTVERAQVLRVADAPALDTPSATTQEQNGLPVGTFYYQVSAVMREDHPKNPGGETLPSDEYSVKSLVPTTVVELAWPCQPDAVRYRIYRTRLPNQRSGEERLLDEVPAPACAGTPRPQVTYRDSGARIPGEDAARPLPPGALGRWVRFASGLSVERGQAAATLVGDDLYLTGGFCSTPDPACPSAGASLASTERAPLVDDAAAGPRPGNFFLSASMNTARRRHSVAVASAATAPASFASTNPDNRQDVWLMVVGGDQGGAPISSSTTVEVSRVRDVNGTVESNSFTGIDNSNSAHHGGWAYVAANGFFLGGASGANPVIRSDYLCKQGSNPTACTGPGSFPTTLNSTGGARSYQQGGARYLGGSTLFRAFIYVAGGFPRDTTTEDPSSTVESLLY